VRLTHKPSGIVIHCQEERSQHKNKSRALKLLRTRLYDLRVQEEAKKRSEQRRTQIGSGDRSERIRTYNFPQSRVTDHRINVSVYNIEAVMDGNIDPLIDPLLAIEREMKLKALAESGGSKSPGAG
jgi:peptide chain release factor 1